MHRPWVIDFTSSEFNDLKKKYSGKCLCCAAIEGDVVLTPDHVCPISLGGDNSMENIQPLCVSCNSKKNTKHLDYRTKSIVLYQGDADDNAKNQSSTRQLSALLHAE